MFVILFLKVAFTIKKRNLFKHYSQHNSSNIFFFKKYFKSSIDYSLLKKLFFLSFFTFYSAILHCQFVYRDSIHYKAFKFENGQISSEGYFIDGKPDGYWITYYANGLRQSEGNRNNNLLNGPWKFYDEKGNLSEIISYKDSKKEGLNAQYKNCYLFKEVNYSNGLKQGRSQLYFPDSSDSKVKLELFYLDDQKDGLAKEYDTTMRIITLMYYKKGFLKTKELINRYNQFGKKEGVWKSFYKNEKVKIEERYKNDLLNGYKKYYDKEGKLDSAILYIDGVRQVEDENNADFEIKYSYHPNGNVKTSAIYNLNGERDGVSNRFDSLGNIVATRFYDNNRLIKEGIVDKQGLEQGDWKFFHTSGKLKAKGKYIDGKRYGKWVFFFENGQIEQEGFYDKGGRFTGLWQWYYKNGKLLRKEEFRRGLEDGMLEEYDESGNLITKGEFFDGEKEGEWFYELNDHKEEGKYRIDLRNGEWIYYYPNGKLAFKGNYIDGAPEGKHKYYYESGVLEKEEYYEFGLREGKWKWYNKLGIEKLSITYKNDIERKIDGKKVEEKSQ